MGPWKKDPKAVTKKITKALHFPDDGEGGDGDVTRLLEGGRGREGDLPAAIEHEAAGKGKKVIRWSR